MNRKQTKIVIHEFIRKKYIPPTETEIFFTKGIYIMDTHKYKQITLTGPSDANLSMSFHVYKHNVFTMTSEFLHDWLPAIFSNCIISSLPLSQAPCQPPLILSKSSVLFYRALKHINKQDFCTQYSSVFLTSIYFYLLTSFVFIW